MSKIREGTDQLNLVGIGCETIKQKTDPWESAVAAADTLMVVAEALDGWCSAAVGLSEIGTQLEAVPDEEEVESTPQGPYLGTVVVDTCHLAWAVDTAT